MKINATTSKFTFLSGPLQVDNLAYKVAHQQFAKYFGSPKVSRRAGGIQRPPVEKKSTYLVGFNSASFFFQSKEIHNISGLIFLHRPSCW